jgi:hypothetical protein
MTEGESKAWERLLKAAPDTICKNALAQFDVEANCYIIKSFGIEFIVSLKDAVITSTMKGSEALLNRPSMYYMFTVLWYLFCAKDISLSGSLVRPEDISGGQLFIQGSHILPLKDITNRYNNDIERFIDKAMTLNGEKTGYGDASIRLFPFPKIPVEMILWRGDEEFQAKASLLFDSTCERHLPVDVLWSIAMMSINLILG